jgi:hypothetical protein
VQNAARPSGAGESGRFIGKWAPLLFLLRRKRVTFSAINAENDRAFAVNTSMIGGFSMSIRTENEMWNYRATCSALQSNLVD